MPEGEKKKREDEGASGGERCGLKGQNTDFLQLGEQGASLQGSKSSASEEGNGKEGAR